MEVIKIKKKINIYEIKNIGEGGKVLSENHAFLNQKTKIICSPPNLIALIKIGDCI
ncbi:MAG: hypothetical protein ACRCVJ_17910 [Clostridium sp.]